MTEGILSVLALLLLLELTRLGMSFGFFTEAANTLLVFFAMMISLRYWFVVTRLLVMVAPVPPVYAALMGFWLMFLIGCAPLVWLTKKVDEEVAPHYPRWLDAGLGAVFGAASGAVIICVVMMSLSIVLPTIWTTYERSNLMVPLDQAPLVAYRFVEQHVLGIPADDPRRTPLPTLDKADAGALEKYWR